MDNYSVVRKNLKVQLLILKYDEMQDYSERKNLRFVVVDLDRAKNYPMNFVCLLPKRLSFNDKKRTAFEKIFENNSLTVAKKMLTDALKSEDEPEIVDEIEKRLSLLDSDFTYEKICFSCGTKFQTNSKKKFKQKYCEDCTRKFGNNK